MTPHFKPDCVYLNFLPRFPGMRRYKRMTQPKISFNGDRQRHEDRPSHGYVRHRVHQIREDVGVGVRGDEKSSADVNTI
jgi:hypothetical protein